MLCGACIALCAVSAVVLPWAGVYFILYLSVFLCCLLCPVSYALMCALLAPIAASLLSGLSAGIQLVQSCAECVAASLIFSLLVMLIRTERPHTDILISALFAIAAGRTVNALVAAAIFSEGLTAAGVWSWFNIISAIAQTVLLVSSIEIIFFVLASAGFIEKR